MAARRQSDALHARTQHERRNRCATRQDSLRRSASAVTKRGTTVACAVSLALPFAHQQFFSVLAQYNQAVWPAPIALLGLAIGCAALVMATRHAIERLGGLALLWAWLSSSGR